MHYSRKSPVCFVMHCLAGNSTSSKLFIPPPRDPAPLALGVESLRSRAFVGSALPNGSNPSGMLRGRIEKNAGNEKLCVSLGRSRADEENVERREAYERSWCPFGSLNPIQRGCASAFTPVSVGMFCSTV